MALDTLRKRDKGVVMKVKEVIRALESRGAVHTRTSRSHRRFRSACGRCFTTVSGALGDEVGTGLAKKIQRDMAPCYGAGWLGV